MSSKQILCCCAIHSKCKLQQIKVRRHTCHARTNYDDCAFWRLIAAALLGRHAGCNAKVDETSLSQESPRSNCIRSVGVSNCCNCFFLCQISVAKSMHSCQRLSGTAREQVQAVHPAMTVTAYRDTSSRHLATTMLRTCCRNEEVNIVRGIRQPQYIFAATACHQIPRMSCKSCKCTCT